MNNLQFAASYIEATCFSNTKVIACQHILESSHQLFQTFIQKGLKKENLSVIGKCYSTSARAEQSMLQNGILVDPSSHRFNPTISFDDQFEQYVKIFLRRELIKAINQDHIKKIIILDDGGELISQTNTFLANHLINKEIIGVEQTTSGIRKLESHSTINFPIINVARSYSKLKYESPMIAKAAIKNIIAMSANKKNSLGNILVIGNGAIGKSISDGLNMLGHFTTFFDKNPNMSNIKQDDFKKTLNYFDTIIGCTGNTIICKDDYGLLKNNVLLISASSSDREFDAVHLRRCSAKNLNCHSDIKAKGINLLNGGFPINFSGGNSPSVPINDIQLTTALLLFGSAEAAKLSNFTPQLIDLNNDLQQKLTVHHLNSHQPSAAISIKNQTELEMYA